MKPDDLQQIQDQIKKMNDTKYQRQTGQIFTTRHTHNGTDTPKLNPQVALQGFPIYQVANAATEPTFNVSNGQIIFQTDSTTFYLWVKLLSGGVSSWRYVKLT